MKIISANRSDTFDEYLRIISRYNENNLVKEAASPLSAALRFGADETAHLTGKGVGEIGRAIRSSGRAASILTEDFLKSGVKNADEVAGILEQASDLYGKTKPNHIAKGESNLLVREGGRIRPPTPDELRAVTEHIDRTGNITAPSVDVFRGRAPGINLIYIRDQGRAVEIAKELITGSPFKNTAEATNFKNLVGDLTKDEAATAARSAEAAVPTPGAASIPDDIARRGDLDGLARTTDVDKLGKGVGKGIAKSIAENRAASEATLRSIEELRTSLSTAIREGDETLAREITRQIDESFQRLDDLLKTEVTAMRESNERLINEAKDSLAEAIRAGDDRVILEATNKLGELESKMTTELTSVNSKIDAMNQAMIASKEAASQANAEISSKLVAQTDEIKNFKKSVEELKSQIENLKATNSAAKSSAEAATSATSTVAKTGKLKAAYGYLVNALKIAAGLGAAYLVYKWYTGSGNNDEAEGGNVDPNQSGGTGVPEDRNDGFQNQMEDPARRESMIDNAEKLGGAEGDALLNKMAAYYRASGYVKLDEPISINGTTIRYAFPTKVSGGVDPVTDIGRREATKSYLAKAYNEDPEKYIDMTTRFATGARSSDPQRIANYAFSITAGAALFSSKGTFLGMGERGKRYGRGKENIGRGDFGFAGTSQKKMTREERRAIENMNRISDADDFMQDDIDDPMQAFASGQNEFFHKKAENINTSTNKYQSYEFAKKADKISNRYFKDAVQDLQDDEFMKAYYSGFSKLHNEKPKKTKPDYEKLYDLHDETGADLVHEAHPKAITVAEAIGKGGLVENGSERSKAMEDIAFRVPSGNYRARYAFIQEALKKKS